MLCMTNHSTSDEDLDPANHPAFYLQHADIGIERSEVDNFDYDLVDIDGRRFPLTDDDIEPLIELLAHTKAHRDDEPIETGFMLTGRGTTTLLEPTTQDDRYIPVAERYIAPGDHLDYYESDDADPERWLVVDIETDPEYRVICYVPEHDRYLTRDDDWLALHLYNGDCDEGERVVKVDPAEDTDSTAD